MSGRQHLSYRAWGIFFCLLGLIVAPAIADEPEADPNPFPQRFDAPSLDSGHPWLNTAQPLDWRDLRGKVVLLDFWTYCCINCMHVLPDLEYLEEKYANELVVIGVHSAKFDNEQDTEAIRSAIQRYEIKHPVINDAEMLVWRKFQCNSWPTLVVVDPEGKYIGFVSGEGQRNLLDGVIGKLVEFHREKGTLNEKPLKFDLELTRLEATPLRFPGKVLASVDHNCLFISDSNHNRIVVADLEGNLVTTIGQGKAGFADGDFTTAQFDHPQGMELVGDVLYVADTENHALRVVDLKARTVTTLAGTGEQARVRSTTIKVPGEPLNSPWALTYCQDNLYIAMAGPHQIWKYKPGAEEITLYAGSGREDILDGPLLESRLAQPSGIVNHGDALYFVDSEGSAVRKLSLTEEKVTTLAGPRDLANGRALFEFGDLDGNGAEARFQHPIGLTYAQDSLFIADSYNHKIRQVDLKTGVVTTFLGTGKQGNTLEPDVQLSEPAGLAVANGTLFIADTNNHRILAVDLKTKATREFVVNGLQPPAPQ